MSNQLTETLSIRTTENARQKLEKWSDQERQRLSDFMRDAVMEGLKAKGKTEEEVANIWPSNQKKEDYNDEQTI